MTQICKGNQRHSTKESGNEENKHSSHSVIFRCVAANLPFLTEIKLENMRRMKTLSLRNFLIMHITFRKLLFYPKNTVSGSNYVEKVESSMVAQSSKGRQKHKNVENYVMMNFPMCIRSLRFAGRSTEDEVKESAKQNWTNNFGWDLPGRNIFKETAQM